MVREHHIMEIHSSMIHIPPGNFELAWWVWVWVPLCV
jgi:hypothetical protein